MRVEAKGLKGLWFMSMHEKEMGVRPIGAKSNQWLCATL